MGLARLGALLTVALSYFAFRGEPILGLAAGSGVPLLVEFVGAAADFVFQIDRHYILTRFMLHNFNFASLGLDSSGPRCERCFGRYLSGSLLGGRFYW